MQDRRHTLIDAASVAVQALGTNGGAWNDAARREALVRLAGTGLPGARDEEWRFTPLASLEGVDWSVAPRPASDVTVEAVEGLRAARIVLVDGYLDPAHSDLDRLGPHARLVQGGEDVPFAGFDFDRSRAFEGLNLATAPDPFVLYVEGELEIPLHLVHHSTAAPAPRLASPCLRVELAPNARARIVEDHVAAPGSADLVNLRVELAAGANAQVTWTRLVRTGPEHRHLARMLVRQARDSVVRVQSMTLGGALVRHDVEVRLEGENSECALHGLVVGEGRAVADNHSLIRHRASHSRSTEHFRNVLDGESRAVFAGRVVVEEGVTGTDARQSNANLLLSDDARVDALPQLEIYNDDVKASHGSTLGQLDRDAMFYLRSRGVDASTARAILTWAFANVVVEEIELDVIRDLVRRSVFEHLPAAGVDEAVLGGLA